MSDNLLDRRKFIRVSAQVASALGVIQAAGALNAQQMAVDAKQPAARPIQGDP